jgi:hypothetical protein
MTEGEVLEVLVKRCQNLGTVSRMNTAVMSQMARRLASFPDMTEEKIMTACQHPANMLKYF